MEYVPEINRIKLEINEKKKSGTSTNMQNV